MIKIRFIYLFIIIILRILKVIKLNTNHMFLSPKRRQEKWYKEVCTQTKVCSANKYTHLDKLRSLRSPYKKKVSSTWLTKPSTHSWSHVLNLTSTIQIFIYQENLFNSISVSLSLSLFRSPYISSPKGSSNGTHTCLSLSLSLSKNGIRIW